MASSLQLGLFTLLLSALLVSDANGRRIAYSSGKDLAAGEVSVTFRLTYHVEFGQGFVITGNTSTLGGWDPTQGILLNYTATDVWIGEVALEAGSVLQFKPVRVVYNTKEALEWLYGPENLVLAIPSDESAVTVLISWCPTPSSAQAGQQQPMLASKSGAAGAVNATFQINKHVEFGQGLVIAGSIPALGSWQPPNGLALAYSTGDLWQGAVSVTPGEDFQYKPVVVEFNNKQPLEWAADPNREVTIPGDLNEPAIIPVRWTSCPSGGSLGSYIREVV